MHETRQWAWSNNEPYPLVPRNLHLFPHSRKHSRAHGWEQLGPSHPILSYFPNFKHFPTYADTTLTFPHRWMLPGDHFRYHVRPTTRRSTNAIALARACSKADRHQTGPRSPLCEATRPALTPLLRRPTCCRGWSCRALRRGGHHSYLHRRSPERPDRRAQDDDEETTSTVLKGQVLGQPLLSGSSWTATRRGPRYRAPGGDLRTSSRAEGRWPLDPHHRVVLVRHGPSDREHAEWFHSDLPAYDTHACCSNRVPTAS